MTIDPKANFDFNGQAKALLKRLAPGPTGVPAPALALAAIEAALREAYARGKENGRLVQQKPETASPQASLGNQECAHEWEEVFLDGREAGNRCLNCGVLQRDVQAQCNHYFVDVGGGRQVCVACRKAKKTS